MSEDMSDNVAAAGPEATGAHAREHSEAAGTGDTRVDEAIAPLDRLAGAPLEEHPAIFQEVHDRLRGVLGELNTGQSGGAGAA